MQRCVWGGSAWGFAGGKRLSLCPLAAFFGSGRRAVFRTLPQVWARLPRAVQAPQTSLRHVFHVKPAPAAAPPNPRPLCRRSRRPTPKTPPAGYLQGLEYALKHAQTVSGKEGDAPGSVAAQQAAAKGKGGKQAKAAGKGNPKASK
jgi:hypothetical protein